MFYDNDDDDVDVGINDRTIKMDIKPTIWQDIAIDSHQNKDFARYLLNYILMNMIIFKPSAVSCRCTCNFYDTFLDTHRSISHARVYLFCD